MIYRNRPIHPSFVRWTSHRAPRVRTDSLLERRGFEPPVLFGFFPLWKGKRSPVQNQPIDRSENDSLIAFSAVAPLRLRVFVGARNHKEDRQFESPPLHQRVSANHWRKDSRGLPETETVLAATAYRRSSCALKSEPAAIAPVGRPNASLGIGISDQTGQLTVRNGAIQGFLVAINTGASALAAANRRAAHLPNGRSPVTS